MKKTKYFKDWEELADLDPKWAVLTAQEKKYGLWDDADFFSTGQKEIESFFNATDSMGVKISKEQALDFGCGLGRLTRALSSHFNETHGVDISQIMITETKRLNHDKNIYFHHNPRHDLSCFADNRFSLIYSDITLQHIPDKEAIKKYIMEFLRITKPGGVIFFYLPAKHFYTPLKSALLKLRGEIYHILISFGVSKNICFRYLKIGPFMQMSHIKTEEIKNLVSKNAEIIKISDENGVRASYLLRKN